MSMSGKEKLLSLLSGSERELVNFKFFPGDMVSTGEELCEAAHGAFKLALDGHGVEAVPGLGIEPVRFQDLVLTH